MQPEDSITPVEIAGAVYFTQTQVAELVGVSRQTVWRWRRGRLIPEGRRFRSGEILFSEEEVAAIKTYATQLSPADTDSSVGTMNGGES